jgi:hypothetical protein
MAAAAAVFLVASSALADKVAVLPFRSSNNASKVELEQARGWTNEALRRRGHTLPEPGEIANAELAVRDGMADTSEELRAAANASSSPWALSGQVERIDYPPVRQPDGTEQEGFTTYRIEIEALDASSGRVESLAREIVPDTAPEEIAEMLTFLVRPGGIGPNAVFPWAGLGSRRPAAKPKPPPAPPKPAEPPPPPLPKHAYAEGHPLAVGASVGVTNALARPYAVRGPSWAVPVGAAMAYAIESIPGLEARGIFTSQVIGPKALEISAGARYAIPVLPQYRVFIGPELLAGAHVAIGAEKTARFLAHGSAFAAVGIGEQLQLEIAADLAAALGGSGTLVLGGGTARVLVRF